jgi:opacity protein-like surface antigen
MLAVTAVAAAAAADTTEERLRQLEQRQNDLNQEMDELREELRREREEAADVKEVERRQGILTDELQRLREAIVLPESKELKSAYGLGPAASKVYAVERGLSIGGYGETNFKSVVSDKRSKDHDEFDFLRFVLYFGYKFNDWIVLNSEIEFEHATSGSTVSSSDGSVSVEFATLDFLLHPMLNVRGGMVLVPVGFVNEIHEPPFFHGNVRPAVETQIIPSTWRANGFGLFGELLPGLEYRTYGITSLNAKGFESDNLRDGRQKGNRERADDWSWVGRLDYTVVPGALIGASAYLGDQGQAERYGNETVGFSKPGVFTQMYEVHGQLRTHGVELRGLAAVVDIDDAALLSVDTEINQTIGDVMFGFYMEIAYDVMPLLLPGTTQYLAPWFRYSRFDTHESVPLGFKADPAQDRDIYEIGVSYKPIPQVILKLDYRNQDAARGNLPDEVRIGAGYVF